MVETGQSAPRVVRERALAGVEGDEDLLRELAAIFSEDASRMLEALGEAIESASASAIGDRAHALKGAVGVFGADAATALAYALERQGRSGDLARASDTFARLRFEIEAVVADLNALTGRTA